MAKTLLNVRYMSHYKNGQKRPFIKGLIIVLVSMLISRKAVHKLCNKIMTMYRNVDTNFVTCLGGIYGRNEGFPKWVIPLKFEDGYFNAPEQYDEYLKQLYGNYMHFPSEDKRKHHNVIYASLTNEYKPK